MSNLIPNARGVMKHFQKCLEQWTDCPNVTCSCEGCATLIPFWWYSGMCEPCALEDCQHELASTPAPSEAAR